MDTPVLNQILDDLEDAGKLTNPDALFNAFSSWAEGSGRPLYPHQAEAATAILTGDHVIAATPTGSGKSMIALAAHLFALANDGRSYYTAPLKALVSEKFFDLVDLFGAENVGMVTGDVSLNPQAPIICCTAEILANQSLRQGEALDIFNVVMDEFHYYSDPQRGSAWQIPLLELPHCQFVLMSATLGDVSFFEKDLRGRTGRDVQLVTGVIRPVPLEYEYSFDDTPDLVELLIMKAKWPIYLVHFAQKDAVERARALSSLNLIDKDHAADIAAALKAFHFGKGFGQILSKLLRAGIGVHHAGMLPRYRRLVERLAQRGLLAVICGTDTLGVGINVPIRTVVLTGLTKFDGNKQRRLSAREFHQIAGRAGRAGFDHVGYVVAQAPPHDIENRRAEIKAQNSLGKKKSPKKSPPKGFVNWSENTFEHLRQAPPEALKPQFAINHAMVLSVLERPDGPEHLLWLAQNNHQMKGANPPSPNPHLRRLGQVYRSLRTAEVIEANGQQISITKTLPEEFALNAELSPFALAALELLDPNSPTYTLDVISVIESILEDPRPVLWAQQDAARAEAVAQMKAQGMDFYDRKLAVEEVTWPRPLAELLEPAYRTYRQANPWLENHQISPKTVVRFLVENAMTFTELISRFNLERSEGVVLRYLTDAYRALRQIIPVEARTEAFEEVVDWLGRLVRSIDSSLLDEWEALAQGQRGEELPPSDAAPVEEFAFGADEEGKIRFSANRFAFRVAIRKALFKRVELLAADRPDSLAELGEPGWSVERWEKVLDRYFQEYDQVMIDAQARSSELVHINESPVDADFPPGTDPQILQAAEAGDLWLATQTILDPEGDQAWRLLAVVDVAASDEKDELVLWTLSCSDSGPNW